MESRSSVPAVRAGIVAAVAAVAWAALECALAHVTWQQGGLISAPGPASVDEVLTLLAAAVAVLLCTWLGASTLAAVLTHLPGRVGRLADRAARTWAPPVSRRLAAVLVGATVTGALAPGTAVGEAPSSVVATAAPAPAPLSKAALRQAALSPATTTLPDSPGFIPTQGGTATSDPGFVLTESAGAAAAPGVTPAQGVTAVPGPGFPLTEDAPGWVPTRPIQRPQPSAALLAPGHARHEAAAVVVHRGDTLWGIVARHLGPHATEAEVATAWPQWYAANRSVIGDDPDLIKPGQVLHAPDAHAEAAR